MGADGVGHIASSPCIPRFQGIRWNRIQAATQKVPAAAREKWFGADWGILC
jgi:hypothetical protein